MAVEPTILNVIREDGAELHVEMFGSSSASGPPILILDGIGCAGWAFLRIVPTLAEHHLIALMHYRGHGRSPTPPHPWRLGMHDLADDAAATIREVGSRACVVVGFSMGVQVSLELYRRHRELVAGLLHVAGPPGHALAQFQGTALFGQVLPFVRAATHLARDTVRDLWRKVLPSDFSKMIGLRTQVNATRIHEEDLEYYMKQMATMNPELFLEMLDEAHRHTAEDVLPDIAVPCLVIAGARDRFVPLSVMRKLAFSIPGARWEVFPDATHALPAEYPDELAERILSFCRTLDEARSR